MIVTIIVYLYLTIDGSQSIIRKLNEIHVFVHVIN